MFRQFIDTMPIREGDENEDERHGRVGDRIGRLDTEQLASQQPR